MTASNRDVKRACNRTHHRSRRHSMAQSLPPCSTHTHHYDSSKRIVDRILRPWGVQGLVGACQESRATGCKPSGSGGFHDDDVLRLATFQRNAHAYYATYAAPTLASFCLLISSEFKKARSLLHDQPTLCRHRPCASRSHLPPRVARV